MGQFHRRLGVTVIRIPGGTLIKSHYNAGPNGSLNIDHSFGCKGMPGAVDVRLKGGPLFPEFASVTQRKNLKAATIGQYGLIPPIKTVQATGLAQDLQAGAQIKVISIAQDNLGPYGGLQIAHLNTLNRTNRTHRHKNRRLNTAMIGRNFTGPGLCLSVAVL